MKLEFVVEDRGDPSVGIFGYVETVTVEFSSREASFTEDGRKDIEDTLKKTFFEMYDVLDGKVYTAAEYDAMVAAENEYYANEDI